MAETETKETDTKAHEGAEPSPLEAEGKKSPKTIADDYMIPMSDGALLEWKGKEGFVEYAAMVAQGLYPPLAKQISAGLTTKILLDPYIQIAKKTIGEDVEPNWDDPLWQAALDGGDKKSGRPVLMSLKDWEMHLKTTPGSGYENTDQAKKQAQDFVDHGTSGTDTWDGSAEQAEPTGAPEQAPETQAPEGMMQ